MNHPFRARAAIRFGALLLTPVMALSMVACSSDGASEGSEAAAADKTITIYSGQHEDMVKEFAAGFEKESGIKVEIRAGDDAELINQIIEEGDRSKADVVLTEEPGPMGQLAAKGLLAKVDPATESLPDQRFVPSDGDWLPFAGRVRALFYNPNLIKEADLPKSIMDLVNPEWKGRFAYAPSGAFVTTVTYLINTIGPEKTLDWLKAIKVNGINEQSNGKIRDSVEAGQHEFGLSNHYYWYVLAKEKGGAENLDSRVHFMGNQDPGALVLASGAGVLKSSKKQEAGQQFLAWLAKADGGQKVVAEVSPQYPLVPGVKSTYDLEPLENLDPPVFDQGSLSDVSAAKDLMIQAGIV
ncbi:MAG TPA: extracellular solute-binding protein [Microthrixaceae bacterium]|nr:extracellular solute-binding protein [Microthrixaceae bacterium]